jgi:hypothetical protein
MGTKAEVWTRAEAIERLRRALQTLRDDGRSTCEVAAERGIFCLGFRRWPASEFDRRWRRALGRSTHLSREQMERLANIWQLAEQIRCRVALACDIEATERTACRGWEEFSDADLARYCGDILGRDVVVAPAPVRVPQ